MVKMPKKKKKRAYYAGVTLEVTRMSHAVVAHDTRIARVRRPANVVKKSQDV